MTAKRQSHAMTKQERAELDRLFQQIKTDVTTSSIDELERFTDLFTKTLAGKGDGKPMH